MSTTTEAAMAAAREICANLSAPPEMEQDDLAAIIQKHFQPLLAKVEGERDEALKKAADADNLNGDFYADCVRALGEHRESSHIVVHDIRLLVESVKSLRADLAAGKEEVSNNMGEWATLMSDVHDYFADEKADRSAGRVRLVLTLLGMMRIERDQLRADLAAKEADTTRLDWCIKHDAHIWLDDGSLYDRPAKWNVSWYPSGKNQIHEHEDLRSAIEAARSALSSRADKGGNPT